MALRARKISGAFEKRAPGLELELGLGLGLGMVPELDYNWESS